MFWKKFFHISSQECNLFDKDICKDIELVETTQTSDQEDYTKMTDTLSSNSDFSEDSIHDSQLSDRSELLSDIESETQTQDDMEIQSCSEIFDDKPKKWSATSVVNVCASYVVLCFFFYVAALVLQQNY